MRSRTRGSLVEGHVEEQISFQRCSSVQMECMSDDVQLAAARDGPSSRLRMWVEMMSGWTLEIPVAPP